MMSTGRLSPGGALPAVTAIIATRDRPELLRRAVRSVLEQDYDGDVRVSVVFDRSDPEPLDDLAPLLDGERRTIVTGRNTRAPGLAGSRNTGVNGAATELVAFCDDDDAWEPQKLTAQVEAWREHPEASAVAAGITIITESGSHVRLPPLLSTFDDLLDSRISELHPSGFLVNREHLLSIGGVDEQIPASYGEDYDLLLRLARTGPILGVGQPLVRVHWNRASYFSDRWQGVAGGLTYLLRTHPEFARSPIGTARIAGQVAFAHAALGDRRAAARWARSALRRDGRQVRAWAALAVAIRLVPPTVLVRAANSRGRGL